MKLKFDVARTGKGWDELQAMREKYQNEGWLPYTNPPSSMERLKAFWDRSFSYDPEPAFEQVTCPTLIVFGGLDSNMPVRESIPIIERALQRAGNRGYTIKVFPTGRHDLVEGEDGGPKEFRRMKRFPPGYWSTMADWVVARTRGQPRR
jgi:pimeloyl-ACP methyl ester carboxylesterase